MQVGNMSKPAAERRHAQALRNAAFAGCVDATRDLQRQDAREELSAELEAMGAVATMTRKEFSAAKARSLSLLRRCR